MSGLLDEFLAWTQSFTGVNIGKPASSADGNAQAATDANTIQTQMQADQQKQEMDRWKILQDTQTKIFEIQQDVTANKAQTQDKAYDQWDQYIRN